MTCTSCGADLPVGARFCHQCGTPVGDEAPTEVVTPQEAEADLQAEEQARATPEPVAPLDGTPSEAPEDVDVHVVDDVDPAGAPETHAASELDGAEAPGEPTTLVDAPDDSQTGIVSPALRRVVPTPPKERRSLEERGTWEEFTDAIVPLLAAPRFTGNLLAALLALALSLAAAVVAWALLPTEQAGLLLPGFVTPDGESAGVVALLTLLFHQVPMVNDEDVWHHAPLLLALVPLAACATGLVVARRWVPGSGTGERFPARVAPFALSYGLLLFACSFFDARDWHAAHVRSFLAGIAFAVLGAWLAERWLRRGGDAARPAGAPPRAARSRARDAALVGVRVFAVTVLAASVGWFVGAVVEATRDEQATGPAIASATLQVVEGGFKAVGFGVLAEGDPYGATDDDGVRIFDTGEFLSDGAFVVLLVTSLAAVIVGGLFSGFAIARRVRPRSRNDHALFGALTGPVWALLLLLAHFVVLSRYAEGDDTLTTLDGVQLFFQSLLVGALLGALGGLLAASVREQGSDDGAAAPLDRP